MAAEQSLEPLLSSSTPSTDGSSYDANPYTALRENLRLIDPVQVCNEY